MANLQHVQRGQPLNIPADDWNKIVDATKAYYEKQVGANTRPAHAGNQQAGVILVRNDSGGDRERFDVLGVDAPIILPSDNLDEFKRQVALVGVMPTVADHASGGRFVVLQEPVKAGALARAVIDGVTPARIDVADGNEAAATLVDNTADHLAGATQGSAQILWLDANSAPGTVLAIVRLGGGGSGGFFWARLTGASSIGDNRWAYPFEEVRYQKQGDWAVLTGGRTGTAYNTMEESNTDTGVQGDGTDVGNYPSGVELQPIGTGVVEVRSVINCDTGATEYVFSAPNNPDGPCTS